MAGARFFYIILFTQFFLVSSIVASVIPPEVYLKAFNSKSSNNNVPLVRVLVGKSLSQVNLSGTDLTRKLLPVSEKRSFTGRKNLKFHCDRFSKKNQNLGLGRLLLASVSSPSGLVSLDSDPYRGTIDIVANIHTHSCEVINEVSLEYYLSGLLNREMNASWPIEALKAQAVAARTYALHKIKGQGVSRKKGEVAHYDLENSESHQVSGSFLDSTARTDRAAFATQGEILVTKGEQLLTPTFFHASCGGKTREPHKVWSNPVPGYREVDCDYCENRRGQAWDKKLSLERMRAFFSWAFENGHIHGVEDYRRDQVIRVIPSSRVSPEIGVYFGDQLGVIHKNTFRRYFGRVRFPSSYFSISFEGGGWQVVGQGNGHGVGMCQVGAYDLARQGWSYRRILAHYFPGHQLKSLY